MKATTAETLIAPTSHHLSIEANVNASNRLVSGRNASDSDQSGQFESSENAIVIGNLTLPHQLADVLSSAARAADEIYVDTFQRSPQAGEH